MSDLHYFNPPWIRTTDQTLNVDVCIYGGSAAGFTAAIEATRRGHAVALLHPGKFIGGLQVGGLGWTDYGKQHVIGGMAREFYRRCGQHYGKPEEWYFEPHVAQHAVNSMLADASIHPILCQYIDRVCVEHGHITSIRMLGGLTVHAKVFIDATYEGDLLAHAGCSFHLGREANSTYGETLNGIHVGPYHQFVPDCVDPFNTPGDPSSGLLPGIEPIDLRRHQGRADHRLQAYNFRICMTNDPTLKVDWLPTERYQPDQYKLADRWFHAASRNPYNEQIQPQNPLVPSKFDIFPNTTSAGFLKTDTNNHGPVSSDFIGQNWNWPLATHYQREHIFQAHVHWQKNFYYHLANSPNIPDHYRRAYSHWGLSRDEFNTSGHWSHTLYIREGRRLISDDVLTELHCMHKRRFADPIGMGSYQLDSHNCTRFLTTEGTVLNEGDVQVAPAGPYSIGYTCIRPKRGEIANLLVPVCCSTSHIAYGSVRMEPVFMGLGQVAGIAASLAILEGRHVQDLNYNRLRSQLDNVGQICELN
jgi:hypothetical protein